MISKEMLEQSVQRTMELVLERYHPEEYQQHLNEHEEAKGSERIEHKQSDNHSM